MAKERKRRNRAEIVKTSPVYGAGKTKSGKRVRAGTRCIDSDGKAFVLLTPAGKAAKAAEELRRGVKLTNDGQLKLDKNGRSQKLTKAERSWRAGVLAANKASAGCFNATSGKK